ncbi:hypothetical protein JCM30566_05600 [Marinitoga arctica]
MKKVFFFSIIILFLLISCMNLNNPPQLEITYPKDNSTNVELNPVITWNATDNENDNIIYNIYLNDEIIKENYSLKKYQLSNLIPDTTYTIKLEAIDEYNAKTVTTISFKTTDSPKKLFYYHPNMKKRLSI